MAAHVKSGNGLIKPPRFAQRLTKPAALYCIHARVVCGSGSSKATWNYLLFDILLCQSGEIGRHRGLKIPRP